MGGRASPASARRSSQSGKPFQGIDGLGLTVGTSELLDRHLSGEHLLERHGSLLAGSLGDRTGLIYRKTNL
jgi:hypothetical protein